MKCKILYVGNNLSKKSKYATSMEVLSRLLISEDFVVFKSSDKKNKVFRLLAMCLAVIKNRKKVNYIIIDTFSTSNFYFALVTSQIARLFKLKYIPILHGGNLPYRLDTSKWFSDLIFKNSYKNIAPSNYLKTEFEQRGYATEFIPNILEIENYKYKERNPLQPKLLWVRAFKHLYNPTLAVEVLQIVKKQFSEAKLCMVGPKTDSSFEDTEELVKKYNLQDFVEFTGVLPKEEWHQKSISYDIFINTTNFDNTPVSVMEAMALGLPIVSTNVGGMPYLIDNETDGVLVDEEKPEQMANAIIKLIEENNQTLAKNARSKAESFGWNVVRKKWLTILK